MKIAINGLASDSGGGYAYLVQLLGHMLQLESRHRYLVFVRRPWAPAGTLQGGGRVEFIASGPISLAARLAYEQLVMPFILARRRVDLLFSPAEVACLGATCKQVLGIQNPNPYQAGRVAWPVREKVRLASLRSLAWVSARVADHVIFVSENARRRTMAALGDPGTPCSVIHHGIDVARFGRRVDKEGRGILCVAAVERHKNLETLIRAYALLPEEARRQDELRIVGDLNDREYHRQLLALALGEGVAERLTFTGGVPFEAMPEQYRRARIFVLPSWLETFGLPLLEAMASGLPVVASSASCLPEICGDAALFFDPAEPSDLSAQMAGLLSSETLRREMVQRGDKRCREFPWPKTAQDMLNLFESLGEGGA